MKKQELTPSESADAMLRGAAYEFGHATLGALHDAFHCPFARVALRKPGEHVAHGSRGAAGRFE